MLPAPAVAVSLLFALYCFVSSCFVCALLCASHVAPPPPATRPRSHSLCSQLPPHCQAPPPPPALPGLLEVARRIVAVLAHLCWLADSKRYPWCPARFSADNAVPPSGRCRCRGTRLVSILRPLARPSPTQPSCRGFFRAERRPLVPFGVRHCAGPPTSHVVHTVVRRFRASAISFGWVWVLVLS